MQKTDPPSPLSRFLPARPFLYLLGLFVAAMIIFTILRLVFLISFWEHLHNPDLWNVITAFLIGLRFDQIVVLAVLLPPLLVLPWLRGSWRMPVTTTIVYLAVVLLLSFLLALADIRFYAVFDAHLNFHVFDYLSEGRYAWDLVLRDPDFYLFVGAGLGLTALFVVAAIWWRRRLNTVPWRRSWTNSAVYFLVGFALTFLGIRGRTDLAPIDWGAAYFSQNRLLNQVALNGVYTLGRTLYEYDNDPRLSYKTPDQRWPFVDLRTALDTVQAMLAEPDEHWLEPGRSLRRTVTQAESSLGFKPNIVLVLMESWSGRNTGCLGSPDSLTPHFDSLAQHSILFRNFYASGTRTAYGISATICSYPSLPGRSILKRYNARHPFITLSEILKGRRYTNAFAYGGDVMFDNMAGFLKTKEYDIVRGEDDFGRQYSFSKWGIPDHLMFARLTYFIDSLPRPFQLTTLTLSNHPPYELPDSTFRRYPGSDFHDKSFNSQMYADWALSTFIDSMRTRPVFDSTLFVFTSDHCAYGPDRYIVDPNNFHTPLLIYGPRIIGDSAHWINTYAGQCDILPTLMHILGGHYEQESWGRDILDLPPGDNGYVIYNNLHMNAYLDSAVYYLQSLGQPGVLLSTPKLGQPDAEITTTRPEELRRVETRMHYYLQAAEELSQPEELRNER